MQSRVLSYELTDSDILTNEQLHPLADACARYSSNYNTVGAMIQASDSML